jgi:hypothetical protein
MERTPHQASVVFPVQDEAAVAAALEQKGLRVADLKINRDTIEVEVKKYDRDE